MILYDVDIRYCSCNRSLKMTNLIRSASISPIIKHLLSIGPHEASTFGAFDRSWPTTQACQAMATGRGRLSTTHAGTSEGSSHDTQDLGGDLLWINHVLVYVGMYLLYDVCKLCVCVFHCFSSFNLVFLLLFSFQALDVTKSNKSYHACRRIRMNEKNIWVIRVGKVRFQGWSCMIWPQALTSTKIFRTWVEYRRGPSLASGRFTLLCKQLLIMAEADFSVMVKGTPCLKFWEDG